MLPSGAKYCRVTTSIQKTATDAHAFCKSIGLSGLLEFNSTEDVVMVAGINTCKKQTIEFKTLHSSLFVQVLQPSTKYWRLDLKIFFYQK